MGGGGRDGRVFWIAAICVVVLDVITKLVAERHLVPHIPRRVFGEWARFTLAYNPGAAFSMWLGPYSRIIFGAFALIALVILWRLYKGGAPGDTARVLALGLAWGGAAGNLIDRVRSPAGVVDFIDIGIPDGWRFWTFNVADSAVTVGAILLAIVLWREDRQRATARSTSPPTAERRSSVEG